MRFDLKATKDTDVQHETVSFVALTEGANIGEVKQPKQRLAQPNNVGKRYFSARTRAPKLTAAAHFRHAELVSASMARRYPVGAAPDIFHTKAQSHEDVAPTAKRLSPGAVRPAAPFMEKGTCRPKLSSSWLCVFV